MTDSTNSRIDDPQLLKLEALLASLRPRSAEVDRCRLQRAAGGEPMHDDAPPDVAAPRTPLPLLPPVRLPAGSPPASASSAASSAAAACGAPGAATVLAQVAALAAAVVVLVAGARSFSDGAFVSETGFLSGNGVVAHYGDSIVAASVAELLGIDVDYTELRHDARRLGAAALPAIEAFRLQLAESLEPPRARRVAVIRRPHGSTQNVWPGG